jgi:hypothetical protein
MDIETTCRQFFVEFVHLTKNLPDKFEFLKTANLIGQII